MSSDDDDEGCIQVNKVACNNLQVKLGDLVNVHACPDMKDGKCIHILPFDDSIEGEWNYLQSLHFLEYMFSFDFLPFFCDAMCWPVHSGM